MVVYDLEYFATHYGPWVGLLILVFVQYILPMIKKLVPAQIKIALADKQAKQAELDDERAWRRKIEAERLVELKEIARSTQIMAVNFAQTNANIATIMTNQQNIMGTQRAIEGKLDVHHNATMDAVADMREEVAKRNAERNPGEES